MAEKDFGSTSKGKLEAVILWTASEVHVPLLVVKDSGLVVWLYSEKVTVWFIRFILLVCLTTSGVIGDKEP